MAAPAAYANLADALPQLPAQPLLSATLSTGSRLEWRHVDASEDLPALWDQVRLELDREPVVAVWPGHTLLIQADGACHMLLSLRHRQAGGSTASQSRLCAAQTLSAPRLEPLSPPAELLHAHAEDKTTLSVWALPMAMAGARDWLAGVLKSLGWHAGPLHGAWTRSGARLESFFTRLEDHSTAGSGLVLVRHDD
ncbi:hypothetical protein [Bordetella genomosp. 12]|uniref:hypothetical protein n=1 Tax=Bordetella genomosp. 12 TaxID=463035 RepID=UPI001FC98E58|nr:hypothetical protein [Bordetella genomosp. 12]